MAIKDPKVYTGEGFMNLFGSLLGYSGIDPKVDYTKDVGNPLYAKFKTEGGTYDYSKATPIELANLKKMSERNAALINATQSGATLGQLGQVATLAARNNPLATAGLAALTAGNIGGLTDGNGFGGQMGGLALGGLGAATLASGNPYAQAMMVLGGGQLGSLFDKLRAKKEQENQQSYYGGR